MADSTAIAIASISASALVGLGAPIVAHVLSRSRDAAARTHDLTKQSRELDAERERADVAELRALLDEVAQNIARALERFYELRGHFMRYGHRASPEVQAAVERFQEAGRQTDVDRARVAIRLGADHPLCRAHDKIAQAIVKTAHQVGLGQAMGEQANLRETYNVVMESGEEFTEAKDAFTAQAAALVGSRTAAAAAARS